MKRIPSAMLVLILILILCTTANAEVYTHPIAGYDLTVPEGWLAIDYENVLAVIDAAKESTDFSNMVIAALDQLRGMPVVLLYEGGLVSSVFRNNINVTLQDLGQEADITELLYYADAFEEELQSAFGDYVVSTPMTIVEIGPWKTAITGGEYTMYGYTLALRQVRLISGTILYEITLTALADDVPKYEDILGDLVASFFAP